MFPLLYGLTTKAWQCLIVKLIIWFLPNILFELGLISPTLQSLIKIVILIIAGIYGRRWSFENSHPEDIDKWNKKQSVWNVIGLISFIVWGLINLILNLLSSVGVLALSGIILPFSLLEAIFD